MQGRLNHNATQRFWYVSTEKSFSAGPSKTVSSFNVINLCPKDPEKWKGTFVQLSKSRTIIGCGVHTVE
jgi:hypothetical protein